VRKVNNTHVQGFFLSSRKKLKAGTGGAGVGACFGVGRAQQGFFLVYNICFDQAPSHDLTSMMKKKT
jgi:hypothetical protein